MTNAGFDSAAGCESLGLEGICEIGKSGSKRPIELRASVKV